MAIIRYEEMIIEDEIGCKIKLIYYAGRNDIDIHNLEKSDDQVFSSISIPIHELEMFLRVIKCNT